MKKNTIDPHELSRLIGLICDCVLDPSRWEQALAAIIEAFDAVSAVLAMSDARTHRILLNHSAGFDPDWQKKRKQEHAREAIQAFGRIMASKTSLDTPFILSRDVPPEYAAQPACGAGLRPEGIADVMQYLLIGTPERNWIFSVTRGDSQGVIGARDIELGGLLLPHLRRAVMISDSMNLRALARSQAIEALNALRCAVVFVNGQCTILSANHAAERMLREAAFIRDQSGALRAPVPSADKELAEAIALAANDEPWMGRAGFTVRLDRAAGVPLLAHVLPLGGGRGGICAHASIPPPWCSSGSRRRSKTARRSSRRPTSSRGLKPASWKTSSPGERRLKSPRA
jgi:hypothetical protein